MSSMNFGNQGFKTNIGAGNNLHSTSIDNGAWNTKTNPDEFIIEPQVDPRMRNAKTPTSMNKVGIIVNGRKKRSERENHMLGSRIRLQHDEPEAED